MRPEGCHAEVCREVLGKVRRQDGQVCSEMRGNDRKVRCQVRTEVRREGEVNPLTGICECRTDGNVAVAVCTLHHV